MRTLPLLGSLAVLGLALFLAAGAEPGQQYPRTAAPDTACSVPSPCPAPSDSAEPEITCHDPEEASQSENLSVHVYGRHLVRPDSSVSHVAYRPTRMDAGGQTNDSVRVHSACHVSTKFYLAQSFLFQPGDTLEFVLVREQPSLEERRQGATGMSTDWHRVLLTGD